MLVDATGATQRVIETGKADMAVVIEILLAVSCLTLTMVMPFVYVWRGGRFGRGVMLSWGMAVLWNFVVSQVLYDYVWQWDPELGAAFPEGNSLVGAVMMGWLLGLVVCSAALGVRRLVRGGKVQLSPVRMGMTRAAIHKIRNRLARNWVGYVREFRVWLILTVVACVADMVSTMYFMSVHGSEAEMHPAIRMVSVILGPIAGPIVGKVCQFGGVVLITIFFRWAAKYVFLVVIIMYSWAAWFNVWGKGLYVPNMFVLVPW